MPLLSVLVVEDADAKFEAIRRVIEGHGIDVSVTRARDLGAARRFLRTTDYDVLVLDIAIPTLEGRSANSDGGIQLLEELEERNHLRMPTQIIGLTGFEDVFITASPRFARRAVSLLKYDPSSSDWTEALKSRIWFAARAREEPDDAIKSWDNSLAIVCALPDPELSAVLSNNWEWRPERLRGDPTIYYRATFQSAIGERTAVVASASQMGMTASAALAMKMALQFRPEYLAMAGITAGRRGRASLGDVLVAHPTWDWGAGKIIEDKVDGASDLLSAPAQLPLHASVRERLQYLSTQGSVIDAIRRAWPDPPATALRLLIGPVASGSAVVEDRATMDAIEGQHRRLLGVEMEAYAVHVAAEEAPEPRPTAFVMKAVVDFAIPGKNDRARSYSAFTSARMLTLFAERYLWGDLPV